MPPSSWSSTCILYAADVHFARPLSVALAQLAAVAPGARTVVFVDGYDAAARRRLESDAQPLDLEIVAVPQDALRAERLPPHLPRATLFRLLLDDLLDPGIDRILYIDVDTLTLADPRPVLDTPGDAPIAAARDTFRPWIGGRPGLPWRTAGADPSSPYFNAGVLSVRRSRWRDADITRRCLDLLTDHVLPMADQDALNLACDGDWDEFPQRWNVQTDLPRDVTPGRIVIPAPVIDEALADPAVVHFTGPEKPWTEGPTAGYYDTWFAALDRTSWAGWRPPTPGTADRALAATRRLAARGLRRLSRTG